MPIPAANKPGTIALLPRKTLWEWPYLKAVLENLPKKLFQGYRWVITDHLTPLPNPDASTVLFYLSNEDGRLPEVVADVKAVFTPYPPERPTACTHIIPLGPGTWPVLASSLTPAKRRIDVFFSGRQLNRRKAAFRALKVLRDQDSFNVEWHQSYEFGKGLSPPHYLAKLAHSKIALAPEGNFSNVTFRHFEALLQGCVVFSAPLPKVGCYADFPAFQLDDWQALPHLVETLLTQPQKLREVQAQGVEYYRETVAPKAVARQVEQMLTA